MTDDSIKKTAVVYDKWLHSLGGGEVVACSIAKILKEQGYDVLFISGKPVAAETIYNKLKIDIKGIKFTQVWNDEMDLKRLVRNKDLFVNISFMDYSIGFAKRNIYYVNFPTKLFNSYRGMVVNGLILPLISKFIKPVESLNKIEAPVIIHGSPAYSLGERNKFALSNLKIGGVQQIVFKIYLENFYKNLLEGMDVVIDNGKILERKIEVKHSMNTINFTIRFAPSSETAYLNLNIRNYKDQKKIEGGKIFLFYPKIYISRMQNILFSDLFDRINIRLRAGIFINVGKRLGTYQKVITYSNFARKWIRRYWNLDAEIVAPPVDMLYKKYKLENIRKKNWICSVGRFFTLGHGKKQEVLIEAFKRLYDKNKSGNWELHLVGGLGDEPTSIDFFKYLKEQSKGYPIFFHINASGKEVEDVYLKSKIYWHATGFGEDENYEPIKFEHFGISPIEALSAKCIPILFKGGGLGEIIKTSQLESKLNLFSTIDELVNNTIHFQDQDNCRLDWKLIFSRLDKFYTYGAFRTNFLKLLKNMN